MDNVFRLIRVFHNLNKSETAKKVGLSLSYVSELESGSKNPSLDAINKYASGFDIPASSLLLFSEAAEGEGVVMDHLKIKKKVLSMLSWLAMLGEEDGGEADGDKEAVSATG